jgi:hypothetical protein
MAYYDWWLWIWWREIELISHDKILTPSRELIIGVMILMVGTLGTLDYIITSQPVLTLEQFIYVLPSIFLGGGMMIHSVCRQPISNDKDAQRLRS